MLQQPSPGRCLRDWMIKTCMMNHASKRPCGLPHKICVSSSSDTGVSKQQRIWSSEDWTAVEEPAGNNNTAGGRLRCRGLTCADPILSHIPAWHNVTLKHDHRAAEIILANRKQPRGWSSTSGWASLVCVGPVCAFMCGWQERIKFLWQHLMNV